MSLKFAGAVGVWCALTLSVGCGGGDGGGSKEAGAGTGNSQAGSNSSSGGSAANTTGGKANTSGGHGSLAVCDECETCVDKLMNGDGDPATCADICQQCQDTGGGGTSASGGSGNSAGSGNSGGNGAVSHVPENNCITAQTCNFNTDCSDGFHCNSAAQQCFDPDPVASSVLDCDVVPCQFNDDCPTEWACSTSTRRCFVK